MSFLAVLFISFLFGVYFSLLVSFRFVTHPLVYCLLLVLGALCLSLISFAGWGFSWYLALFVLVYVGGVYVLFLFISVHRANSYPVLGLSTTPLFLLLASFVFFFSLVFDSGLFCIEESHYLCSGAEGIRYMMLCFSLLVGFAGIRVVSGQKDSFFR